MGDIWLIYLIEDQTIGQFSTCKTRASDTVYQYSSVHQQPSLKGKIHFSVFLNSVLEKENFLIHFFIISSDHSTSSPFCMALSYDSRMKKNARLIEKT